MSNAHKGELSFEARDQRYTLKYSANAICEIEAEMDRPMSQIAAELEDPKHLRMSTLRVMFWAGLVEHHPDLSLKDAGLIMTDLGTEAVGDLIGEALAAAFPDSAPKANGAAKRHPQKPGQATKRATTGPAS